MVLYGKLRSSCRKQPKTWLVFSRCDVRCGGGMAVAVTAGLSSWNFRSCHRGSAWTPEDLVPCHGGWVGGGLSPAGVGWPAAGAFSGGTLRSVTLGGQQAFSRGGFCLARSSPGPLLNRPQQGWGSAWGSPRGRGRECRGDRGKERWRLAVWGPGPEYSS